MTEPHLRTAVLKRRPWKLELAIACPKCGQSAGETCITSTGFQAAIAHRSRIDAYAARKETLQ